MTAYLLKSGACIILLLAVYHLLLEREKMHRFNRFYLLFGLLFSLIVPLLSIDLGLFTATEPGLSQYISEMQRRIPAEGAGTGSVSTNTGTGNLWDVDFYHLALGIYLAVTGVMAVRFIRNIGTLVARVQRHRKVYGEDVTLVLVDGSHPPHSFFHYVFVDRDAYASGAIEPAVLDHERVHAQQLHSLDILFIELLKVVFWFNPAIYFYKKAIRMVHEFLADEAVLSGSCDVTSYRKLLLRMKTDREDYSLASSIHFSITKKRFIMMTKTTNRSREVVKKLVFLPLLAGLLFLFGTARAGAQDVSSMTLYELLQAANDRMETVDSLSAAEKEKLATLLVEMRQKLHKQPPPPPQKLHAPPVPEEPVKKVSEKERVQLENQLQILRRKMEAYKKISPDTAHLEELQSAYSEMKEAFNDFLELQEEIYGEDAPPAPPILRDPQWRIKNEGSK